MRHAGEGEGAAPMRRDRVAAGRERGRRTRRGHAFSFAFASAPAASFSRILSKRFGAHAHVDEHRRADEDRRIGGDEDAPDHRRRERADDMAAEEEQRQQREKDGGRGHDGARQHRVDRHVDDLGGRQALVFAHHLADAVEHDHRLVERIADDGEDRRDRGLVELELGDAEEADRQQEVVHRADDRPDRELPLEAEPQIGQDRDDGDDDAERAALDELGGNGRADRIDAAELVVGAEGVPELGDRGLLARRRRRAARRDAAARRIRRRSAALRPARGRGSRPWRECRRYWLRRSWRACRPGCRRRSRCRNSCPRTGTSATETIDSAADSG